MEGCIFCRIAAGQLPATMVDESEDIVAFRDIEPRAPTHVLIIPRRHMGSLNDAGEADQAVLGRLLLVAQRIAESEGIAGTGYRVVMNTGEQGGQSVDHVHLHLLGGRSLGWPPG